MTVSDDDDENTKKGDKAADDDDENTKKGEKAADDDEKTEKGDEAADDDDAKANQGDEAADDDEKTNKGDEAGSRFEQDDFWAADDDDVLESWRRWHVVEHQNGWPQLTSENVIPFLFLESTACA